jgi:DNA-binding transcriptional LysR family regulator
MSAQDDLRIFTSVVDHAGLAPAAKVLGLTRSAVCRRIDRFEKRLGVRLLDRTTRRTSLTDAGEALYRRGVRILSDIAEAELVAGEFGVEPQGVLRVTCPIMIGLHLVVPLLPGFLGRYKGVKVQLDLADDGIDPALADHDVGIRWGEQQTSALIITRLAESRQVICAAPAYLDRFGTPRTPHDLLDHNCILMSRLGLAHNEWTFRLRDGLASIKVSGNFVVNGGHGNYEAVMAALGIARATDLRVAVDIRAGRLRRILRDYEPGSATPIYAVYKSGRLLPPKIRSLVNHLREHMRVPRLDEPGDQEEQ